MWGLGAGFGCIVLLFAFAPQILALSAYRHDLPRSRLPGFQEQIRVGRASLSWWGNTELWDVEYHAPDGEPFLKIGHVVEGRTAWQSTFRPAEPFALRLENPVLALRYRPDGSNIADALAPCRGKPKGPDREKSIEVTDATFIATDATTGHSTEWRNVDFHFSRAAEPAALNRLHLTAESAGAPDAKPLELDYNWTGVLMGDTPPAKWEARVQAGNLPCSAFAPLLARFAPELQLSGTVTGDVHFDVGGDAGSNGNRPAAGKWQIATRDFEIASPKRLGDDRLALDKAEFQGDFVSDGVTCRVEKLDLTTDVGQFHGSGAIPLVEVADAEDEKPAKAKPKETTFTLRGDLDLVAMARLMPQTIPMREGAKLTEGKVKYEVTTRTADGKTFWKGHVDTTRIAATIGDEKIAWDEPLRFDFDAHRENDRFEIDSLDCQSDFLHLTGRGDSGRLHAESVCDLDRLAARLGDFFGPDFREMHGKLTSTLDAHREDDGGYAFDAESTIDKLLIRQKVKRMVERRRGEVEPVEYQEPEASPPPPPAPRPLAGQPVDRRTMRQQRRADRIQQRDTRRREAEAVKKAEEVVFVPVEEWQTLWSEPHGTLTTKGRFVADKKLLELRKMEAVSEGVRLTAAGKVSDLFGQYDADFSGESTTEMEKLVKRFRDTLGPYIQLRGTETREFSFHGPLRAKSPDAKPAAPAPTPAPTPASVPVDAVVPGSLAPPPLISLDLGGTAGLGWKNGDLFGLEVGPGDLRFTLDDGIVTMRTLKLPLSGGALNLAPQLYLNEGPAHVKIPAGTIVDNVELTNEICDCWLKYIAPVLSQATRTEGQFSVDLDETRFPLADPASGDLSGHLRIAKGQVMPGPVFVEISMLISKIVSAIDGLPPRDFVGLDVPLVQINGQDIEFKLEKRRIYHTPVDFTFRNMIVRTEGSVGVDESLDIVATIYFSDALMSRLPILAQFREHPPQLPVRGTLRKPALDPQAKAGLIQKLVPNAVQGIIQRFQQRGP